MEFAPVAILNAPASIGRLREVTEELVTMSREHGREVKILASSAERGLSFGKSPLLKDDILYRSRVLDKGFSLSPHSTLIVESVERLGLKEMLVLSGEAKEKDAQLIFLDSAGRQSNANVLLVLSSAGVPRHGLTEPVAGLDARVISIGDKRDRYRALAERYADLSSPDTAAGAGEEDVANREAADAQIAGNSALAELLGLTGTPGIIVMPAENATADNTTVIPGVVSAQVMQQAIDNAMK